MAIVTLLLVHLFMGDPAGSCMSQLSVCVRVTVSVYRDMYWLLVVCAAGSLKDEDSLAKVRHRLLLLWASL